MSLKFVDPPKKTYRDEPPPEQVVEDLDRGYIMLAVVICGLIAGSIMIGLYVLFRG